MLRKLKLMWFGITHVIEITDYLAERIDHVEGLTMKVSDGWDRAVSRGLLTQLETPPEQREG